MILTDASRRLAGTGDASRWVALARRGMLWSEVQAFDVVAMGPGVAGPTTDPDYLEVLFCAAGSATATTGCGPSLALPAGTAVVYAAGSDVLALTAGTEGATVVRVRLLPQAASRTLPPRWPSLRPPGANPESAV
jgi:hypothetical protein